MLNLYEMTAVRSRKQQDEYRKYLKTIVSAECVFCIIKTGSDQLIEETDNFKVIINKFPYSLWDGQKVIDHKMITPKKHVDSLKSMQSNQKVEYVDLLEKYEKQGYNVYFRAPVSVIKTVVHQHTHLIKTTGGPKRFVFHTRKPYFRMVR